MLTLATMTTQIVDTFNAYDAQGTAHRTYETAAFDLPYQVGNLAKAILQKTGRRHRWSLTDAQLQYNIADELADIMAEVLFIAHELGIDMEKAWEQMLMSDAEKIAARISH